MGAFHRVGRISLSLRLRINISFRLAAIWVALATLDPAMALRH
jgi:hypothetical protein